ncbi:MAG TPA: hypothetical protein VLH13_02830, partial [Methanomassiliicoccales archaeon]|nr:hypothetical protein [Methanomassiliicoccales archaeon]
ERAVGHTCSQSSGVFSERLRIIQWRSLVDRGSELTDGITDMAGTLGNMNGNLRQSLQLLISASAERTRLGVERLLERANELVVQGVREQVDRYVASLSLPTMVLFAFGILLPVMLFSLVPLFSIRVGMSDGGAASPALGMEQTAFLMLVVFPLCSLIYAVNTLERHPLRRRSDWKDDIGRGDALILLGTVVLPLSVILSVPGLDIMIGLVMLAVLPSAYILLRWEKAARALRSGAEAEQELVLALFQIGNRMMSGSSLESSFGATGKAERGRHLPSFVRRVLHASACSGRSLAEEMAEDKLFVRLSPMIRNAYMTVASSAALDPMTAGRTALNLAKYVWDLRESEVRSRDKLRSVVDMMTYTAMLFAPIVLAITGGLFHIVQTVAPVDGSSDLSLVGGIYAIELCLVVAYFNQNIMGDGDARLVLRRFAVMAPVAEAVHMITALLAEEGFSSFF